MKWSLAFLILSGCALAQSGSNQAAVVNGEVITQQQVEEAARADLANLELKRVQFEISSERDRNAALENALNRLLEQRVLVAEAQKRNISVEQLVVAEVENGVPVPSDEAVVRFYEENRARINGTLEQTSNDIRAYLRDMERERVFAAFVTKLRTDYGVKSYLEPSRTTVETAGHPSKGPANAPITIVEFSDFECPFCAGLTPTLHAIETKYKDKVRIVYRQFPLTSIHPNAQKAAEASLCANDQNRFWQMHDVMFLDQRNLTVPGLKQKAALISLDTEAFNACLDSHKYAERVSEDVAEGSRIGVTGTPAFLVNGRFFSGNLPYPDIEKVIEDELQRQAVR
jgi:protein-disulfide isomerase